MQLWWLCIAILGFSTVGQARTQSVDLLTTITSSPAPQMVINSEQGFLHPPIEVIGHNNGSGTEPDYAIDLGDGSDGPFNSDTYEDFASQAIVGNVIVIDTDVTTELNVTDFELDAGFTLRPTGSNPLIIRSLGEVDIDGTIDCSGDDGEDTNTTGNTFNPAGGTGRCGGLDGGNGASISVAAEDGDPNSIASSEGGAGTGTDSGGGGGGSYTGVGNEPDGGVGAGGAAGLISADHAFSVFEGGAGGGGGAVGTDTSSGAGGGAGGGVVLIIAYGEVEVSASGSILATGGDGGGNAGANAGGGGGGGGGSIAIFSADDIVVDGPVDATRGAAGVSAGGNGGRGGVGRTWLTDASGVPSGGVTEDPTSSLILLGTVEFDTGAFEVESEEIDLLNTLPTLQDMVVTDTLPSGSSVDYEIATFENSGESTFIYSTLASLQNTQLERFARYKLTVNNVSSTDPVQITSLNISVDDFNSDDFQLVSSCGSINGGGWFGSSGSGSGSSGNAGPGSLVALVLFVFPVLLWVYLRRKESLIV